MGGSEENEIARYHGCRNWNVATVLEVPELAASVEVVSADVFPTVENDLSAAMGGGNGGSAPRAASFFARRAPELTAVFGVEYGEVFFAQDVALNDDFAVVEDRRTGEAPLESVVVVRAGVHFAEVLVPLQIAVHVEAEETFGAEDGDNSFAICSRRRIAVGRFGVAFDAGNGFEFEFIPYRLAAVFIEAEQTPLVPLFFVIGFARAVDANLEIGFAAGFDGSRDIDAVLPDDWAGVPEAGNSFLPANVFAGFYIPIARRSFSGDARSVRAAELGPVGRGSETRKG